MTQGLLLQAIPAQPTLSTVPGLPTFLLSSIVWVPTIAAIALLFFPARTEAQRTRIRTVATAAIGLVTALAVLMWSGFRDQTGSFPYEENHRWIPSFGTGYHLGVDGISMPLLLLSTILFLAAVLASTRVRDHVKEYFFLLLILETGVNGVFASLDYVLFFLFWEMQVVPVFFLTGFWGGRRTTGAWKYLVFAFVSSALLLLAILITAYKAPSHTFDIPTLHDVQLPASIASLAFWLFFGAFAVQLAVFPAHTWFLDAQADAPAPVGALLAGAGLTLGAYGLYRVNLGEFFDVLHKFRVPVLVIALATILWSALAALREDDLRRLIGYVAVSRLGFVLLAADSAQPVAINGGVVLMVASGLSSAALILIAAGLVERTNTRSIRAMGGLAARMPRGAAVWGLAVLASLGLPGLAGFVGQLMILLGTYPEHRTATMISLIGLLLIAAVMVSTVQRIFFGPLPEGYSRVRDLGSLELTYTASLVSLVVLFGLVPGFFLLDSINSTVPTLLFRGGG